MSQLIIKWGHQEYHFTISSPQLNIGRADSNLLQLKDVKISREHCQISQTPDGYLLSDAGSVNGTFLNGQRIDNKLLHNNDIIRVGGVEIIFSEELDQQKNILSQEDFKTTKPLTASPVQDEPSQEKIEPMVIPKQSPETDSQVIDENSTVIITDENIKNSITQSNKDSGDKKLVTSPSPNKTSPPAQEVAGWRTGNLQNKPLMPKPSPLPINPHTTINQTKKPLLRKLPLQKPLLQKPPMQQVNSLNDKKEVVPETAPTNPKPAGQTKPPPFKKKPSISLPPMKAKTPAPSGRPGLKTSALRSGATNSKNIKQPEGQKEQQNDGNPQSGKKNLLFIIGGVLLVVIVIVALVLQSASSQKAKEELDRGNKFLDEAEELYKNKGYTDALKKYQMFLKEFKNSEHTTKVKEEIKNIESKIEKEKTSQIKLAELLRKKKDCPMKEYPELLKEFENFIKEYQDTALVTQAQGEMDSIKRIAASEQSERQSKLFTEIQGEVSTLRKKKDYDGALTKLQGFLKQNPSLNERQRNLIKEQTEAIKKEKK